VLASRSDYFKALLDHAAAEAADRDATQSAAEPPAHEAAAEVRMLLAEMQMEHVCTTSHWPLDGAGKTRLGISLVGDDPRMRSWLPIAKT